jgi:hypothetical protein
MNVLKMIGSTAFLMANKEIIRLTDIETAILYSDLAGAQDYWSEKNEIQDGYFYRTQNEIELNTTLSAKVQLRCLRLLEDKGLIKTKLKGLPAKKYFCIDNECIYRLSQVLQKGETCIAEKDNQVNPKSTNKSGENVETSLEILDNQVSTKVLINNNRVNNNKEIIIDNNNKESTDFKKSASTSKKEKKYNYDYTFPINFDDELKATFEIFLKYKIEKKQAYKENTSVQILINRISKYVDLYDAKLLNELILDCIGNNYQGIIFDKLPKMQEEKNKHKTNTNTNSDNGYVPQPLNYKIF